MNEHLRTFHKIDIHQETLEFSSFKDFMTWKADEEFRTQSYYVQQSGCHVRKATTTWYFYCNRSGHYKAKGAGKRSLKLQGTAKIGGACSAHMTAQQDSSTGKVVLHYCSTHAAHEKEIAHLRIPDHVRLDVAAKLQQGVTIERILDDLRDGLSGEMGREHLTNRQDIRNVLHQYNICGVQRHANDHTSVCAWVEELRSTQEFDPVLLFKQQGDDHEKLGKEDFLLCIQTEFQHEMLKKFGHKVVCMDATHSTNSYEFLLITVLVVDEFGEGVPVAWAISNKEDTTALSLFLEEMRSRSGHLSPEYFMSDDAQQYWNSWAATYGAGSTKKLLCTWHVDRAWRKALHEHIADAASKATVYHQLRVLLSEVDQAKLHSFLPHFLTSVMTDHPRFYEYFRNTYAKRVQEWASCHRVGSTVNTNMHVESFHRLLKVVYLQGKQNRRLDHLIHIVLKVARDKGFERLQKIHKGKASHRVSEINRRHKKAEDMLSLGGTPTMKSAATWEVISQGSEQTMYVVELQADHQCTCQVMCAVCKVCPYEYSCTCADYAVHNTACKHIHLVHTVRTLSQDKVTEKHNDQPCGTSRVPDELNLIVDTQVATLQSQQQLVVSRAAQVAELARSTSDLEALKTAAQHLNGVINMMKAVQKIVPSQSLPCRKRPAPNSNMETQMRYHPTRNKRAKSNISLAKPTVEQAAQARETLEAVDVALCSVCLREDDGGKTETVDWVECTMCGLWVHKSCVRSIVSPDRSVCDKCNSV